MFIGEGHHETIVIKYDGEFGINNNSMELKYCNKMIDVYVLPRLFEAKLQYRVERNKQDGAHFNCRYSFS